jgi:hypothetical protein
MMMMMHIMFMSESSWRRTASGVIAMWPRVGEGMGVQRGRPRQVWASGVERSGSVWVVTHG